MTRSCASWTSRRRARAAGQGPPAAAAAELVGLHGDVDVACATLSAAWPTPVSDVPDVLAPDLRCVFCGINPGASPPPRTRTSRTRATTSGGCCTTPASRRACSSPRSSSSCSSSASASRTPPTARRPARATCAAATSTATRLERLARELRPRAIAFVGKEAYRGLFGERPELGPQLRTLGSTALFVLPSTSPANAAVPYAERLRWFAALRDWLEPVPRAGGARARRRRGRARAAGALREPGDARRAGGRRRAAGSRPARATRRRCAASCSRRCGLDEFELGPGRLDARARLPVGPPAPAPARALPPRPRRARTSSRRRSTSRPRASTATAGGRSTSSSRPTSGSRRARSRRRATLLRDGPPAEPLDVRPSRPARWKRSSSSSICSPRRSGSAARSALVFAGVPAIRTLEGEPRGRAMKELGLRWRPLGYGALLVARAHRRRARAPRLERGPLAVPDRALGEGRRSRPASSPPRTCTTSSSARGCRPRSATAARRRRARRSSSSAGRASR